MSCYYDFWYERELPPTTDPPSKIDGLSVEQFLIRYPEFKSNLEDPSLGEDYLDTVLLRAAIEIQYGSWPEVIQVDSVYLLTAHILQRQFEQQASTATAAVRASQGDDTATSRNEAQMSVQGDLASTVYGQQLVRLQTQTRQTGGIIV